MLLSLNDDCLRLIGEFLPLKDQISLAHVCERLQAVLEDIWHHTSKKFNATKDECVFFESHENYFYEFMRCISDNVEELELYYITSSCLQSLSDLEFPKMRSLTATIRYGEVKNDQDIKLFVKLFPQLSKLSICSDITGRYLWQLENLNELLLNSCESLREKHFKKIFSKLNLKKLTLIYYGYNASFDDRIRAIADCKTLEELYIDDHHLITIIDEILKLKRMRKITTYTRDYDTYLLGSISRRIGTAMDTMIFNDVFWSHAEHCESVQKMINLRRLIFIEDDIENEQLRDIGRSLCNTLEEFHFNMARQNSSNEQGFIDLLTLCLNLKVFDVSCTAIDIEFVERVAEIIARQRGKRKTLLLMRCHNTKVTQMDLESLVLPEMLQISFEKSTLESPGSRHFQCEWRTQCDE